MDLLVLLLLQTAYTLLIIYIADGGWYKWIVRHIFAAWYVTKFTPYKGYEDLRELISKQGITVLFQVDKQHQR